MAFLYPREFPEAFGCVEKINYDPSAVNVNDDEAQLYPKGISLQRAMALIWKSKQFSVSGSGRSVADCCNTDDGSSFATYLDFSFYGQTISTTPSKMSELACINSPNETGAIGFYNYGSAIEYVCFNAVPPIRHDTYNGFSILYMTIYLYNNLYYIPIIYEFGAATNRTSVNNSYCGNFTLDGIKFPLYQNIENIGCSYSPLHTNVFLTTSATREAK